MLATVGNRAGTAVCRFWAARSSGLRSAGAAAAGMTAIGTFCSTSHATADALPELDDPVDYFRPNREHGAAMYGQFYASGICKHGPTLLTQVQIGQGGIFGQQ